MWTYYPHNQKPPEWVTALVQVVAAAEGPICTEFERQGLTSDAVLAALADGLLSLGYEVESGKTAAGKVRRPVLFGENGSTTVTYEVDAAHDALGIVVEVEAGRGARGNAAYRDIIRTSLILDAKYLVLLMPITYRISTGTARATTVPAYRRTRHARGDLREPSLAAAFRRRAAGRLLTGRMGVAMTRSTRPSASGASPWRTRAF